MPIGKNSIKRVANNGYSAIKSNAPDMQNSTVIANISPEVVEVMIPKQEPENKAEAAPKKKASSKKKTAHTAVKSDTQKDGFIHFSFGEDLPPYLL